MTISGVRISRICNQFILACFFVAAICLPSGPALAVKQSLGEAAKSNWKAVELYHAGKYDEAIPYAEEALEIRERILGPEHPDVAQSLSNLGLLYKEAGDYERAEPLYHHALKIKEKALGSEHPDTLTTLNNLAMLYQGTGNYTKAGILLKRVLEVRKRVLGPEHPDTGTSLNNLAMLYQETGNYVKAELLFQHAMEVNEKILGIEHPNTLTSLGNLAELYRMTGNYSKAEPLLKRALKVREKILRHGHPDTAHSLNSLALLYEDTGNYAKATPLLKRSLQLSEKTLGSEHPQTALALGNLANLYKNMGNYTQAGPLLQRALEINEKVLGPEHPQTALSLQNMAVFYDEMGNFEKAAPLYMRALKLWEKRLGPDHPQMALLLTNLGGSAATHGAYTQAEPFLQRALKIRKKTLGSEHPDTLTTLNNLALLYQETGNYTKAEMLLKRTLEARKRVLGSKHPDTAISLNSLAYLYGSQHKPGRALSLFRQGIAIEDKMIQNVFMIASEQQKLAFVQHIKGNHEAALSLIYAQMSNNQQALRSGLDLVLARKGVVFDAQARQQETIAQSLDTGTRKLWDQLSQKRAALAKLLQSMPEKLSPELYRVHIADLQSGIAQLEVDLASKSRLIAEELKQRRITSTEVAGYLAKDTVLAEFVRIRDFDWDKGEGTNRFRYLVFVLHRDQIIELIDLGDADRLDKRLNTALASLKDMRGSMKRQLRASERLYATLWEPLSTAAGDAKTVVISPDGLLNLVPFGAMRDQTGKYLMEKLLVSYVTSGRDLLKGDVGLSPESALYLAANPQFDLSTKVATAGSSTYRGITRSRGFNQKFVPLPGTKTEAVNIPKLIHGRNKRVVTGKEATEASVLSARRPGILHMATHGFFLKNQRQPLAGNRSNNQGGLSKGYENPLIRSGLALAGANHAAETEGSMDGLLTALEVSSMDLHGTDLVTLSACETGVGKVMAGEGVFGLRRAFSLAGASNLLMSLWPVSDTITAKQMQNFYQFYGSGMRPARALRKAQLETIRSLREQFGSAPPALWAPFILQGAPG